MALELACLPGGSDRWTGTGGLELIGRGTPVCRQFAAVHPHVGGTVCPSGCGPARAGEGVKSRRKTVKMRIRRRNPVYRRVLQGSVARKGCARNEGLCCKEGSTMGASPTGSKAGTTTAHLIVHRAGCGHRGLGAEVQDTVLDAGARAWRRAARAAQKGEGCPSPPVGRSSDTAPHTQHTATPINVCAHRGLLKSSSNLK